MIDRQHSSWRWTLIPAQIMLILFVASSTLLAERAFSGCGNELIGATNGSYEARVVELVNQERAARSLPPMKINSELTNVARYHAADMSQDDYFNHQTHDRSDGALVLVCTWTDRVKGYYTANGGLAENLAVGDLSPESVMAGWMGNSEHRASILGNYREIGVGYYNDYWVQDLGDRTDSYPLVINGEAQQTDVPTVSLYIYGTWQQMRLRNNTGNWSEWQIFQQEKSWTLDTMAGEQWVEVELKDETTTVTARDSIWLTATVTPAPTPSPDPTPPFEIRAVVYLPTIQQ